MAKANWIDVSYFQDPNKFDYQAAKKAGIQGLIIRAGYGKTQDTAAAQHIANAQKYGFMWHLYHYWYNMGGEDEWAVQNAKRLGLTANQYLFLDMEDKSLPADWNGQFAVFRKAVGDTYKVGLYCSDSPYKAKFQDSQLQQLKVARWVASYSYEPANYDIWQMSGAGSGGFGSYTGDIDRDYTKSDILSLYAMTNVNPVVTKPTADLQYIQPIMLQPGYDTETNIYGLGYSPDNGVHFYVTYTTFGAKYRQEDADRLWKYLQGFVSKQIHDAVSLTWDNIKGKPDLVLRSDLPDFNQFALKKDLPDTSGLAKAATVDAVKTTAESALSTAEKAQSTANANSKTLADKANKSEIPDISGLAKKSDIPVLPDLNSYALKSELP
ncbi:GH25 family lysozyme, partial [Limosilactobacillus oris]|uniref:GH25 family lysozyme n=1 Tax=Limosilactobacillus oris TaxID=1632 RepID=UPI003890BF4C